MVEFVTIFTYFSVSKRGKSAVYFIDKLSCRLFTIFLYLYDFNSN